MFFIIENHKAVFDSCFAAYEGRIPVGDLPKEAFRLLCDLNYVDAVKPAAGTSPDVQHQNRTMLLGLARKLEKIFELPMPFAPGGNFVGGMVSAHMLGVEGPKRVVQGVGGRGMSLQRAFEGCLGEAAEFLSFLERENDPLLHQAPERTNLAGGEHDRIKGVSLHDQSVDWFPASKVLRRQAATHDVESPAPSTGVSAGPSIDWAITSGLFEVVERDAVALWWYGGQPAGRINDGILERTGVAAFAEHLRGNAERPHWLLDLTTEFGIPVVAALSSRVDGTVVVAGFGAGLNFVDAAKGALLEMSQMELAQEISISKLKRVEPHQLGPQDKKWIRQFEALSIENYPRLKGDGDRACDLEKLHKMSIGQCVSRMHDFGYHSYYINLTRPDVGIPVVRVVISGLQPKTPSPPTARLVETAERNKTDLDHTSKSVSPL